MLGDWRVLSILSFECTEMLYSSGGVADDEAEDGENKQASGPTKQEIRLVISTVSDLPHCSALTADTQPRRSQKKRRNPKRRRGTWMPLVDVVTSNRASLLPLPF